MNDACRVVNKEDKKTNEENKATEEDNKTDEEIEVSCNKNFGGAKHILYFCEKGKEVKVSGKKGDVELYEWLRYNGNEDEDAKSVLTYPACLEDGFNFK